jgi:hypothetical protein
LIDFVPGFLNVVFAQIGYTGSDGFPDNLDGHGFTDSDQLNAMRRSAAAARGPIYPLLNTFQTFFQFRILVSR